MSKILLTGAAGFIAARTAALLVAEGHSVVGIDNLNATYDLRLKNVRLAGLQRLGRFVFHSMDVENRAELAALLGAGGFDAVVHLAARCGVRYSLEDPHAYLATNVTGTLNVLDAMRRSRVRKIVLASTSSLYAGQSLPFDESAAVNTPISPYAASKKAAEAYAYTYHHLFDLDVSVLRFFTVYGPAGRPDMSPFRFLKWIDEGSPISLYGDGLQSRDFTYVDDIARGIIAALKPVGHEIINVGCGRPWSLLQMIRILEQLLEKPARIEYLPAHKTDMADTQADISKARRVLGWEPEVEFQDGLARSVTWYRDNYDWVRDIKL